MKLGYYTHKLKTQKLIIKNMLTSTKLHFGSHIPEITVLFLLIERNPRVMAYKKKHIV